MQDVKLTLFICMCRRFSCGGGTGIFFVRVLVILHRQSGIGHGANVIKNPKSWGFGRRIMTLFGNSRTVKPYSVQTDRCRPELRKTGPVIEIPESRTLSVRTVTEVFRATHSHKLAWYAGDPAAYAHLLRGRRMRSVRRPLAGRRRVPGSVGRRASAPVCS